MLCLRSAQGTKAATNASPTTVGMTTELVHIVLCSCFAAGIELTPYRKSARPGDRRSMPTKSKLSDGWTWSRSSTRHA